LNSSHWEILRLGNPRIGLYRQRIALSYLWFAGMVYKAYACTGWADQQKSSLFFT
tara:strand:- start:69 stop:233 length:165 start_codon:yes stop_codon:yes gene_type:complete